MSYLDPARESPPDAPEARPNEGALILEVDGERIPLTEALHWVEDGEHIIASTEFQVAASGDTFWDAYLHMAESLVEEAQSLVSLIQDADAAPNERDEALALFQRFQRVMAAEENAQRQREQKEARKFALRRRNRRSRGAVRAIRSRQWQIRSKTQPHSARPLPV